MRCEDGCFDVVYEVYGCLYWGGVFVDISSCNLVTRMVFPDLRCVVGSSFGGVCVSL